MTDGYLKFSREDWAALREATPLTLQQADLEVLRGLNDPIDLDEVADVLLPLTRLLNLHIAAARALAHVTDEFLARPPAETPYVIAIAGSVAVGKSTFARALRLLLSRWPDHPRVELVTTDGFLHPTRVLVERNIMRRKGFPESYDLPRMVQFLADVKSGEPEVDAPVYSHMSYDIVPGEVQTVRRPDVLIFEGLNVLQPNPEASTVVSDFFDFSIYLDAEEDDVQAWYVERFLKLQRTAFQNPASYFHHYKDLGPGAATHVGLGIWRDINLVNLRENIFPTRTRANLVLRKNAEHAINEIWLKRT